MSLKWLISVFFFVFFKPPTQPVTPNKTDISIDEETVQTATYQRQTKDMICTRDSQGWSRGIQGWSSNSQ